MDMSRLNLEVFAEKGATMELLHPVDNDVLTTEENGKGEPITISLLGSDSKAFKNKSRELARRRVAKYQKSRNKSVDHTVSDEEASELLVACTTGWSGIVVDGEQVEFSEEAAMDLYCKNSWIREQVDAFVGDRASFFTD